MIFTKKNTSQENEQNKHIINIIDLENIELSDPIIEKSPFYQFFKNIHDEEMASFEKIDTGNNPCTAENTYFCPHILSYSLNGFMPYYPLWSSVTIK